jgi:hypothetical protein
MRVDSPKIRVIADVFNITKRGRHWLSSRSSRFRPRLESTLIIIRKRLGSSSPKIQCCLPKSRTISSVFTNKVPLIVNYIVMHNYPTHFQTHLSYAHKAFVSTLLGRNGDEMQSMPPPILLILFDAVLALISTVSPQQLARASTHTPLIGWMSLPAKHGPLADKAQAMELIVLR